MGYVWLLALVVTVVQGGQMGSRVASTLYALDMGAGKLTVGLLIASYSVFPLILAVHAGRIVDWVGTRGPAVWGCLSMAVGLAVPAIGSSIGALFLSAGLIGLGFAFFNVSTQSLAGHLGPRSQRTRNFSTLALGYSASGLLGPVAAGYLIEGRGYAFAFGALSAALLLPVVVLAATRALGAPGTGRVAGGGGGAFDLLRNGELRRVLIAGALIATGWDLFNFYVPVHGHAIQLSPVEIGKVLGAFAVGTFAVRVFLGRLTTRYRIRPVLVVAMIGAALLFLVYPWVDHYPALLAVSFLCGMTLGVGQPLMQTMAFNRSPEGRAGEVTGLRLAINNLNHVAVPLAAGALGSVMGAAPVFALTAAFLVASAWLARRA